MFRILEFVKKIRAALKFGSRGASHILNKKAPRTKPFQGRLVAEWMEFQTFNLTSVIEKSLSF
jgi:hypothetical protein